MEATTQGSGGAQDPPAPRDAPSRDEAGIGALLARAHLLRMRGQWDEAVAACTEALRRVPHSATACALLGDIYEAQGKLDIAMHWFGMAVEFDPGNRADRAKLDRIVAVQRRTLLTEEMATRRAATGRVDPANRTLQWFDGVFPPGKQETLARLILFVGGGLFLLLTFAAAFVYFGGVAPEPPARPASPAPGTRVVVPPLPEPPAARPAPPARRPETTPAPPITAIPPAPEPSAASAPLATAPPDAGAEDALRRALIRAVPAEVEITGVQVDPRSSQVALAITLAEAQTLETTSRTRERVLRAAVEVLRAAAGALPQMRAATVRVSIHGGSLAFVGDAGIPALRALDPASAAEEDLRALFTNPWWTPALDPASSPRQP